jgi:hypothetical protein
VSILQLPNDLCGCGCGESSSGDGTLGNIGSTSSSGQQQGGGNVIGTAISAIGHVFSSIFGGGHHTPECSPPGGCFTCQIKGSGGIAGCIDTVTQQWIAAAQAADANPAQRPAVIQMTQGIVNGLANEQFFTPQSDTYLTQAKQVFEQRLHDQMAKLAQEQAAGITTGGGTNTGTTGFLGLPATVAGIPTTELLFIAGGGLIAFSLLRKN